jgi:hypothetical protein
MCLKFFNFNCCNKKSKKVEVKQMSNFEKKICMIQEWIQNNRRLDAQEQLEQMLHDAETNEEEVRIKDILSDLLEDMGYYSQALDHRKSCLKLIKSIKGDTSLDMLKQSIKMSNLLWTLIDKVEEKSQVFLTSQECLVALSSTLKLLEQYPDYPDCLTIASQCKQRLICTYLLEQNISKMHVSLRTSKRKGEC